ERAGSYFVADNVSARPRLSVQMPEHSETLVGLQPAWAPLAFPMLRPLAGSGMASEPAGKNLPHLAIRIPASTETNRASSLMPIAPDAPVSILPASGNRESIDLVIRTGDPKRLETLLRSVAQQRGIEIGLVRADVLRGSGDPGEVQAVLNRLVPGRGIVNILTRHCPIGAATLLAASSSACTLVADESIILHDPRTLETLAGMVKGGNAASAGCVVLREVGARRGTVLGFESGGYFPSHVSLIAAPRLIVSLPDTRGALPNATYPVLANDPALVLLGNEAARLAAATSFEQTAGTPDVFGFSLAALAGGYRHLCTTALRATVLGPLPAREASDPPGIAALEPGSWPMVLGSLVILRELH
uniref:hypothetical protein n=1 Tax=Aestuariivirga sp. TaxID=2650926 RepID=UPI003594384F